MNDSVYEVTYLLLFRLLPVRGHHSGVICVRSLAQVSHRMPFLMEPGFELGTYENKYFIKKNNNNLITQHYQ